MARNVKAIQTAYAGCKFRSRLEARWAVFFDVIGVKWEYEQEGFVLADGTRYLPDFYLPHFCNGLWVEVKPVGGDFSVAKRFAIDSGQHILLAEGSPDLVVYGFADAEGSDGDACFDDQCLENRNEQWGGRMFYYTGLNVMDKIWYHDSYNNSSLIYRAVQAARSARFEFGETPLSPR